MSIILGIYIFLSMLLIQIFVMAKFINKSDEDEMNVLLRITGVIAVVLIIVADKSLHFRSDAWLDTVIAVLIWGASLIILPWPFGALIRKATYAHRKICIREILIITITVCFLVNIVLFSTLNDASLFTLKGTICA